MREFDKEVETIEVFAQKHFNEYVELDFAASNDIWLIVQHCFEEDSKYYLGNDKSMIIELKKAIMVMAE